VVMSNEGDGGSLDFLEHFSGLEDPRQRAKVLYPLDEILLLTLCAVLSAAEGWVGVALFGERKLDFLRRFLPFANGTPSHDQLGLIFAALDKEAFQQCFLAWASSLAAAVTGIVAVDGKTLRRSFDRAGGKAPIHMISAWSSRQRLVLGQRVVNEKSNEIAAIPHLLDLLTLKGAVVTLDAMGCQKEIAARIVDQKADYVLGLKGNQGALREDVELLFKEQAERGFADLEVSRHRTVDADHGRLETRETVASEDIDWLRKRHPWKGLRSIAMVTAERETTNGTSRETRFFVSSLPADAQPLAEAIRAHWGIENGLHWVMDVVFRDDDCRIRKKNAPANFATVKHMAVNLLRKAPGKHSLKSKRHLAAWDNQFLSQVLKG
jgi:predicted transposase YbfD/YdcC